MRDYYINNDPFNLGGHCCKLEGQAASNNGGEKRGGIIKLRWRRIVHNLSESEKKNPILVLCACASVLDDMKPLSQFAVEPTRSPKDYDLLRKMQGWKTLSVSDVPSDILYMLILDENRNLLDTRQVIGN